MTPEDTARVVAKIQLGDNRVVDALTVREWHDSIGHLEYEDCIAAVTLHRQSSTEYLMPAHITRNVVLVRNSRPLPELEGTRNPAPAPLNMKELTEAYRSGDPHRISVELGRYNRQIVDAGRPRIPEWPLPDPVVEDAA